MRQDGVGHMHETPEVNFEHFASFFFYAFLYGTEVANTGIVHEHINAARISGSSWEQRC